MKPASEFRIAQLPAPGCPPAVNMLTDGEIMMQENRVEGQKASAIQLGEDMNGLSSVYQGISGSNN